MTKRILIAGLLGGLATYIWSSVAHIVLPLGETGIQQIATANEPPFLEAMKAVLQDQPGMYLFPSMPKGLSMDDYAKKLRTSPSGILIYTRAGADALTPRQLMMEFVFEVGEVLLLAFLLTSANLTGFAPRLTFVLVAALLGSTWTNLSYWNWYSFPVTYTLVSCMIQFVGLVLGGLVVMRMTRR